MNIEGTENFVESFLKSDDVKKWLYGIFVKSSEVNLFARYLEEDEDFFEKVKEYKDAQTKGIESNKEEIKRLEDLTEDKKEEIVQRIRKDSLNSLESYLKVKEEYAEKFTSKLKILEELKDNKNEFVAQTIKNIYEDLNKIFTENNDVEMVKSRIESVKKEQPNDSIGEYKKVLELNIKIFEQRLKNADAIVESLEELKKELILLPQNKSNS